MVALRPTDASHLTNALFTACPSSSSKIDITPWTIFFFLFAIVFSARIITARCISWHGPRAKKKNHYLAKKGGGGGAHIPQLSAKWDAAMSSWGINRTDDVRMCETYRLESVVSQRKGAQLFYLHSPITAPHTSLSCIGTSLWKMILCADQYPLW